MMFLHICVPEKFTRPFIEFTAEHFAARAQKFLFQVAAKELRQADPATFAAVTSRSFPFEVFFYEETRSRVMRDLKLLFELYRCQKIIIHGLFPFERLAQYLAYCPLLLRKSYWAMWGGDFYFPEHADSRKRRTIRKMGHLLSTLAGDVEYVRRHYGATGEHIDCLVYPTNVFRAIETSPRNATTLRVQVGNSAFPTNQHHEVFEALAKFRDRDIEIICPLSYGDDDYRDSVVSLGKKLFAEKFLPLVDFLPYEEYQELIASIDIAIFNSNRQQGMGNIITHLGLGHKVYLRSDQSPWKLFTDIGVELHDVLEGIDLEYERSDTNRKLIASHFTYERLAEQWRGIYEQSP